MKYKISLILSVLLLSACASKDMIENIDDLPPTASGEIPPTLSFWSNISGKTVRNLTRHARYPGDFNTVEGVSALDFPDAKGDKFGQRISGLLEVPSSGQYRFYVSADESAEVWLSIDEHPINKRLVALVNKPSGYLVFDRYTSQISSAIPLEQGQRYFFEVIHKDNTGADYLNVSWSGPGFDITTLTSTNLKGFEQTVVGADAYEEGYHVGYESGRHLSPYDLTYPVPDSDGDGLPDFYEAIIGLDSNDPTDALNDLDDDLLSALDEYLLRTNPLVADSDGDGMPDGFEVIHDLDANDANDAYMDIDGDGISNVDEYLAGSLLDDSSSVPDTGSTDGSGSDGSGDFGGGGSDTNQVTLSWEIPDTRADGTQLLFGEIKEYKIYGGSSDGNLTELSVISDPSTTSTTLVVDIANVFFSISTVTTDGVESSRSTVINVNETLTDTASTDSGSTGSGSTDTSTDTSSGSDSTDTGTTGTETAGTDSSGSTSEDNSSTDTTGETTGGSSGSSTIHVALSWQVPNTRSDGTPLLFGDIREYKIYAGSDSGNLSQVSVINNAGTTSATLEVDNATAFFSISTVTTDGAESAPSTVINVVDGSS